MERSKWKAVELELLEHQNIGEYEENYITRLIIRAASDCGTIECEEYCYDHEVNHILDQIKEELTKICESGRSN